MKLPPPDPNSTQAQIVAYMAAVHACVEDLGEKAGMADDRSRHTLKWIRVEGWGALVGIASLILAIIYATITATQYAGDMHQGVIELKAAVAKHDGRLDRIDARQADMVVSLRMIHETLVGTDHVARHGKRRP